MSQSGPPVPPSRELPPRVPPRTEADRMLCDRCASEMYRMHAVWRCPRCGFKTDCCGW